MESIHDLYKKCMEITEKKYQLFNEYKAQNPNSKKIDPVFFKENIAPLCVEMKKLRKEIASRLRTESKEQ